MAKMSSRGGEPWALQKAKREVTKDVRAATIEEVRLRVAGLDHGCKGEVWDECIYEVLARIDAMGKEKGCDG